MNKCFVRIIRCLFICLSIKFVGCHCTKYETRDFGLVESVTRTKSSKNFKIFK